MLIISDVTGTMKLILWETEIGKLEEGKSGTSVSGREVSLYGKRKL